MKKRLLDEQIVRMVGESRASGVPVTAKKHGISAHMLYLWRSESCGFQMRQVAEFKRRQQKLVAERGLELEVSTIGF